jgi:nucleoside-diphosphate-sugar epimerase
MPTTILLAGAAGAVGRRLTPLLIASGYKVFGTTRSSEKAELLRSCGAEPLVLNVFDTEALRRAFALAQPDIVMHQLTDLPPRLTPDRMKEAVAANARIRREGTANLVRAALAVNARHIVAQSIAWACAPGPLPHSETDPLDVGAKGDRGVSVGGVAALEEQVLHTPGLRGTVLRYGQLYGPGTGFDEAHGTMPLHVDAAAFAAVLAAEREASGVFNVAEPNGEVSSAKAGRDLGWNAAFRMPPAGAQPLA